jgi:membrane-bound lytic murein transglycosylase D
MAGVADASWALPLAQDVQEVKISPLQLNVDQQLKKNVDFWIKIYSFYTTSQGLIHDAKYIDHIYEVLDFRSSGRTSQKVKKAKQKWRAVLLSLHRKQNHPEQMTEEERQVFELYQDIQDPNKFLKAAHKRRLRFQLGQRNRFLEGLYQSGKYLPMMEEIFKAQGMPPELTRLPFVESSFNVKARSNVGASGIWQFMRSTARLFIQVDDVIDERNDPIRATYAAAQLLKLNYTSLQKWPLAVTAYNHGRKGLMRAVRRVGSDELERLMSEYRQRSFGFASSNFYAELLAVIEVERNAEKYFGNVDRAHALSFFEVQLPDFIGVQQLIQGVNLDPSIFKELNSSLTELVFSGQLFIPLGYPVRIPSSENEDKVLVLQQFWKNYELIPTKHKLRAQRTIKYGTRDRSFRRRDINR